MNKQHKIHNELSIISQIASIGLIYLDKDLLVIDYSPLIKKLFKINDNFTNVRIDRFIDLKNIDLISLCNETISSSISYSQELKSIDGIWFKMQIDVNEASTTNDTNLIISFFNIHDLKIQLLENKKFENFYSNVIDTNPAAILIYNVSKKSFVFTSNNTLKIVGHNYKINDNFSWETIINEEDIDKVKKNYNKISLYKSNKTNQIEYRVNHEKTNKTIWLLSTSKVYQRDNEGKPISIITSIQNINKVKELEIASSRIHAAFQASNSAIWEWDSQKKNKIWWSTDLYELTGWSEKDIEGNIKNILHKIHNEDIASLKNNMKNLFLKGITFEDDIRLKTQSKGLLWFKVCGTKQKNSSKIIGTLEYIHKRKIAENNLKRLNKELKRFTYLASHDLKEPIQTIDSFIGLIKKDYDSYLDKEGKLYIDYIDNATKRLISLINDLLSYLQLDNASIKMDYYNVTDIYKNVEKNLKPIITTSNAEIKVANLPTILCYEDQLQLLFTNLISNSIKYTDKQTTPKIEIGCKEKDDNFNFYIKDNGIGIDPLYYEKVFKVFKRLHSRHEYEGNGIGLAISKKIITNHYGRIWLKSDANKGVTVYFTIPKMELKQ